MPTVSVIIPTYNYAHFISEAVQSVLDQTYQNFEILIIDDGSTDNTRDVVLKLMENTNKIRYFYQANQGLSAARNRGIREAKSEYVALLDSDDIWLKKFLEKMTAKIEEGFDWVVCDNVKEYIDVSTNYIERLIETREIDEKWDFAELIKQFLIRDRIGGPSKIMVRRKILTENNIYFDGMTNGREDWDFYLELLKRQYALGLVRKPLYIYRIRSDGSNLTRRQSWKGLYATFFVVEKHKDIFLKYGMQKILGDHYFALARGFWKEYQDIMKFVRCLIRNVQCNGMNDLLRLLNRKIKNIVGFCKRI
jgi:glycosyltransferase involved in cell wall biosynthesis